MMDYAFTHHLYSYETRMDYNKYCIMEYNQEECDKVIDIINGNLDGINYYDYLRDCAIPQTKNGEIYYNSKYYKYARWAFKNKKISKNEKDLKISNDVPCFDDTIIENYFNREDVQAALHVEAKRPWTVCSDEVWERYESQDKGSIWVYPTLLKEGIRILIYNGDTDAVVPFNGNQIWIKNLKLEIEKPWRQWRAYNDQENISGYVTKYKGLTFCTIKGTGHMAPQWKPKESFYMFSKFLNDEEL